MHAYVEQQAWTLHRGIADGHVPKLTASSIMSVYSDPLSLTKLQLTQKGHTADAGDLAMARVPARLATACCC